MDEDALIVESGISLDMQIHACGRLRGGATYGEWVCSFCIKGGCWASPVWTVQTRHSRWYWFPTNDTDGIFGNSNIWVGKRHRRLWVILRCEDQCLGVLHRLLRKESLVPRLKYDMVLPVLGALWFPSELLEEVRRRLPVTKPLRERGESQSHGSHTGATPVPTPAHVSPVPTPQRSDAEGAGNEEGAIGDFDLGVPTRSRKWSILHNNGSLLLFRTHVTLKVPLVTISWTTSVSFVIWWMRGREHRLRQVRSRLCPGNESDAEGF